MADQNQVINSEGTQAESASETKENTGNFSDVIAAAGLAIIMYGGLIWFAKTYQGGDHAQLFILAGITATALGWVLGIFASPYSGKERSVFSELARLIYGFISGYVLSKLDPLITRLVEPDAIQNIDGRYVALTTFTIACFLIAAGVTYVTRSYWVKD